MSSLVVPNSPSSMAPSLFLDRAAAAAQTIPMGPSKKRPRSAETVASAQLLAMPPLCGGHLQDAVSSPVKFQSSSATSRDDATSDAPDDVAESDVATRRSLMSLSLQLKLKLLLVEAWASDMNAVVMERNLFAIARELAVLKELGVFEEQTCVRFLELARARMASLLAAHGRRERLTVEALPLWSTALVQALETLQVDAPPSPSAVSEFPLLPGSYAAQPSAATATGPAAAQPPHRDLAVLWKAMTVAKDRGAQLWHENKPEQALPFLLAADSYMKRFTLKYQRLKIDHALLDAAHAHDHVAPVKAKAKRVAFAEDVQVLGVADAEVDRSPIAPTKPSKLESLLLRTAREFPTPPM